MPISSRNVQPVSREKLDLAGPIRPEHILACGARDTETMLARYQEFVQQELRAQQCFWLATYKGEHGRETWRHDKMLGWKIMAFATPIGGDPAFWKAEADAYLASARERGLDPLAGYALAHAGETRVHSNADVREELERSGGWIDDRLSEQHVAERIVGAFNLSPIAESFLLVGREEGEPPFTSDDAKRLRSLVVAFPRVHHWLALERGLVHPAKRPFSPRERDVIGELLGPDDEQTIADRLELSRGTAHNYVVEIYRNLGVRSRHEMVQLWLGNLSTREP